MNRCILTIVISVLSMSCSNLFEEDSLNKLCGAPKQATFNSSDDLQPTPRTPPSTLNIELEAYSSCSALEADLIPQYQVAMEDRILTQKYWDSRPVSCNTRNLQGEPSNSNGSTEGGVTNRQEARVDEGDLVKTSQSQIFVSKPDFIEVVHRTNLDLEFSIDTSSLRNVTLLFSNSILVAMGQVRELQTNTTRISLYQTEAAKKPKLLKEYQIQGDILSTRLNNGKIIVVTTKPLVNIWEPNSEIQLQSNLRQSLDKMDCRSIYKPLVSDLDGTLSTIHQFDLAQNDLPYSQQSIVGRFNEIYMNENNLYLTKTGIFILTENPDQPVSSSMSVSILPREQPTPMNAVVKINMEGAQPSVVAAGTFLGRTVGAWAYKEVQGLLAVATTTGTSHANYQNHLLLLENHDGILKKMASVDDFGSTEDIRSVRYIKDKAYIVTFKKTDPLFIIDLQNPLSPTILSELKAPGFSRYMHPTTGDKLMGLGYGANDQGSFAYFQGVQLSLFDVSDPTAPGIIEQLEIGDRGSYSDVLFNHQAFYHNETTGIVGFPIVKVRALSDDPWGVKAQEFTGAQFYKVSPEGFESMASTSHSHWIDQRCSFDNPNSFWWNRPVESLDINRVFELDNKLFTLSRFGMAQHSMDNPEQLTGAVRFHESPRDCGEAPVTWGGGD